MRHRRTDLAYGRTFTSELSWGSLSPPRSVAVSISRRTLFRNLGAAAIAGVAAPALRGLPIAAAELVLPGNTAPVPRLASTRSGVSEPILLNLNENPYGPSEKVLAILRDYSSVGNRYPHTEYDTLIDKLAAIHRVKREQIVLGCGSSEILSMAATALLKNGKKLVQAAPTCSSLGTLAQRVTVEVTNVPLNKRYEHDLPAMLVRAVSSGPASTGFVYIVNPNNPTGTITPRKDIEAFLAELPANIPVLIDEVLSPLRHA
jgi:histidinol-phosphate aminotransferase